MLDYYKQSQNLIGIQPINWSNDDFHDLGGKTSIHQCLREMGEAGYMGTELGHKFPTEVESCQNLLREHQLKLISGWHSTYLAKNSIELEIENFVKHAQYLKSLGSDVVILAECTGRTYHDKICWVGIALGLHILWKCNGDCTRFNWVG